MCGIIGAVDLTGLSFDEQKFFRQGLYADALRGVHSTGVMTLTKGFETAIYKKALNAADFLQLTGTAAMMDKFSNKTLMLGHNRHATMGAHIDVNSHPFNHGNITMVHNGSLRTQWQLDDNAKFDVDSEVIAHNLNKNGVDATIPNLNGAFSLVWYDAAAKSLNFIRNSERPMHYAVVNNSTMIFGSEPDMLRWIAGRNKLNIGTIQQLKTGSLMTLDMSKKQIELTHREIQTMEDIPFQQRRTYTSQVQKPQVDTKKKADVIHLPSPSGHAESSGSILNELGLMMSQVVPFVPVAWEASKRARRQNKKGCLIGYLQDTNMKGHTETYADCEIFAVHDSYVEGHLYESRIVGARREGKGIVVIMSNAGIKKLGTIPWVDDFKGGLVEKRAESSDESASVDLLLGPNGTFISAKLFNNLTSYGCSACSSNISESDHEDLLWVGETTVLCPECSAQADSISNQFIH